MALHKNHERERTIFKLEGEIARQQETIEKLRAEGQSCPDAQRQLEWLKNSFALLR